MQVEITECSTYAVVCRLKASTPYIITSNGGSLNLSDHPDVCVTIPMKAVAPGAKIPLQIKVDVDLLERRSGSQYTRNNAIVSGQVCIILSV